MHKSLILRPKRMPTRGLVGYWKFDECRNLLKYSQQFDNATWSKVRTTVVPNAATAPDGTETADRYTETADSGDHTLGQLVPLVAGVYYTGSIYVKKGTLDTAPDIIQIVMGSVAFGTKTYANINLTTGLVTQQGSATSVSIAPVAGAPGWYRCSIGGTCITSGENSGLAVMFCNNNPNAARSPSYLGTISSDVLLWGAQLEVGPYARDYVPTTDKQLLKDYANRSRNLLMPTIANAGENGTTSAFAVWGTGVTLSSSTEQAWQGSRSLKVVCDGTVAGQGQYYQWYTYGLSPGKTYTGSVYVKGTAGAALILQLVERTDAGTGTGGGASVNFTATGGWDRVVATFTAGATGRCANMRVIVNGTLATTFYCDGLQLEEGSVATEWEAPPNHGILGSAFGADTNDPAWVREGLSYGADDYVKFGPITDSAGTVQPMGAMVTAFYTPVAVSAASAKSCSFALAPNAAIYLGAVAGAPANNIVTVQYAAGSYSSWCDAAATITAGWHTLAVAWNGTAYDLYLDGAMLPTTTAGTPALLSPTAANCCYDGTTYGPGIVRAARGIWARSLGAGELARARAYLRNYLAKFGVVLP